jgi:hypothetical protein
MKPKACKRLPAIMTQVSRENYPEHMGKCGSKRLSAVYPDFIYPLGPTTVQEMCQWPVDDLEKLLYADQLNHYGTRQTADSAAAHTESGFSC